MARRKKQDIEGEQPKAKRSAIGGNVSDETLRHFERKYVAAVAKLDAARAELANLCKQAADIDGIDVKTFKQVQKLKKLLPNEAEAKIHTFTRYTQQLGLFDAIEQFRQAEANADNEASVEAAEREWA